MHGLLIPRRRFLDIGRAAAITSLVPARMLPSNNTGCAPPIPNGVPANGGPCPYPIPWLDKNGNHNQMPKANIELNHFFHFKGKSARCQFGCQNIVNRLSTG
jgi:hypothetical protein